MNNKRKRERDKSRKRCRGRSRGRVGDAAVTWLVRENQKNNEKKNLRARNERKKRIFLSKQSRGEKQRESEH